MSDFPDEFQKILLRYCLDTPGAQIQDVFKYIYQSAYGCEHLLTDYTVATDKIKQEISISSSDTLPETESLCGEYCRVHLKILENGLAVQTLAKMFLLSAKPQINGRQKLLQMLDVFCESAKQGTVPFEYAQVLAQREGWKADGYTACHHSEAYKQKYHPAYRVVKKDYADLIPLCIALDSQIRLCGKALLPVGLPEQNRNLLLQIYEDKLIINE